MTDNVVPPAEREITSIEELTLQELVSINQKLGWFKNLAVLIIILQVIGWFLGAFSGF